ncbi:SDR family oxidoreductase [Isoptericola jiangsuensis]|uniref:SDR family oxidoreductase n=1 Tax=Isoptericola jiangsuensis TaxID=548579 RepID=UPI003AACE2DE
MSAVLVTGATGTVGSAVVQHLLERDQDVVAGVRADADAARLPDGARPRRFEFGAPTHELEAAFDGVDRLFLMRPPPVEDVATYLFPVIDAARRRGVHQIVFLSLQGVQANRRAPHHAVEAYLRQTGAPFTSLRPNFFMQNLSGTYVDQIRDHDEIFVPAGRSHTAFIDARDIGRVAATVMIEPGHVGEAYTLSGEQSLTYRQVAQTLSDVLGRTITYRRPSEQEYLARLVAEGYPADYVAVQKMLYRIVRYNVSALPNRAVRRLTGRPATTFREFAVDHRAVWER